MRIQIPSHVEYIIGKLNQNGYEAFAVGGCVRDTLLGRTPGDWDITTSARPEQVKALFRRTIDTGIHQDTQQKEHPCQHSISLKHYLTDIQTKSL